MYYTHPGCRTSIFGENRAYCIRDFTVSKNTFKPIMDWAVYATGLIITSGTCCGKKPDPRTTHPVADLALKVADGWWIGIAIPEHFSNPGISGLKNANPGIQPGIPGLSPW